MTKTELIAHLERLDACEDSLDWLRALPDENAADAWAKCDRVDWMLWLAGRCDLRRNIVDCACDFAERPLAAVEAWFAANAPQHTGTLTRAIAVARDPNAAARSVAYAATAARSARSAAAYAAYAAADAAYAATAARSARCAWSAAERSWQFDRLRQVIPWATIQATLEAQS